MLFEDWLNIIDLMWQQKTLDDACAAIGVSKLDVLWHLNANPEMSDYLLEVSMLASLKEKACRQAGDRNGNIVRST
jgi:hypothetical protein